MTDALPELCSAKMLETKNTIGFEKKAYRQKEEGIFK